MPPASLCWFMSAAEMPPPGSVCLRAAELAAEDGVHAPAQIVRDVRASMGWRDGLSMWPPADGTALCKRERCVSVLSDQWIFAGVGGSVSSRLGLSFCRSSVCRTGSHGPSSRRPVMLAEADALELLNSIGEPRCGRDAACRTRRSRPCSPTSLLRFTTFRRPS